MHGAVSMILDAGHGQAMRVGFRWRRGWVVRGGGAWWIVTGGGGAVRIVPCLAWLRRARAGRRACRENRSRDAAAMYPCMPSTHADGAEVRSVCPVGIRAAGPASMHARTPYPPLSRMRRNHCQPSIRGHTSRVAPERRRACMHVRPHAVPKPTVDRACRSACPSQQPCTRRRRARQIVARQLSPPIPPCGHVRIEGSKVELVGRGPG